MDREVVQWYNKRVRIKSGPGEGPGRPQVRQPDGQDEDRRFCRRSFAKEIEGAVILIGVLINTLTVLAGSTVGLLCKRGIPERLSNAVMLAIGLCSIYIGIAGALEGQNTLVLIISMVLGTAAGTLLDLDGKIGRLGRWVEEKFPRRGDGQASVAEGFVTACLLFCVGSMTIVGCLNAGLAGDQEMLFTKSTLDLISSMMLSVSLGVGVLLSAAFVLTFQGGLVLLAGFLKPALTSFAIAEMTCAGSVMILALGLNLIGVTKIKVADFLPALLFAPLVCLFF